MGKSFKAQDWIRILLAFLLGAAVTLLVMQMTNGEMFQGFLGRTPTVKAPVSNITSTTTKTLSATSPYVPVDSNSLPAISPMIRSLTVINNPHNLSRVPNILFKYWVDGFTDKNGTLYASIYQDGKFIYSFQTRNNVGNGEYTYSWDGRISSTNRIKAGTYTFQITGSAGGVNIPTVQQDFSILYDAPAPEEAPLPTSIIMEDPKTDTNSSGSSPSESSTVSSTSSVCYETVDGVTSVCD